MQRACTRCPETEAEARELECDLRALETAGQRCALHHGYGGGSLSGLRTAWSALLGVSLLLLVAGIVRFLTRKDRRNPLQAVALLAFIGVVTWEGVTLLLFSTCHPSTGLCPTPVVVGWVVSSCMADGVTTVLVELLATGAWTLFPSVDPSLAWRAMGRSLAVSVCGICAVIWSSWFNVFRAVVLFAVYIDVRAATTANRTGLRQQLLWARDAGISPTTTPIWKQYNGTRAVVWTVQSALLLRVVAAVAIFTLGTSWVVSEVNVVLALHLCAAAYFFATHSDLKPYDGPFDRTRRPPDRHPSPTVTTDDLRPTTAVPPRSWALGTPLPPFPSQRRSRRASFTVAPAQHPHVELAYPARHSARSAAPMFIAMPFPPPSAAALERTTVWGAVVSIPVVVHLPDGSVAVAEAAGRVAKLTVIDLAESDDSDSEVDVVEA